LKTIQKKHKENKGGVSHIVTVLPFTFYFYKRYLKAKEEFMKTQIFHHAKKKKKKILNKKKKKKKKIFNQKIYI